MPRYLRFILKSAILVLFVIACAPYLVPFAWHLMKKQTQAVGPYTIAVPNSFVIRPTTQGVKLFRFRTALSLPLYRFALITIETNEGRIDLPHLEARMNQARESGGSGYFNGKRYELAFDDIPLACIERQQADNQYASSAVFCMGTDETVVRYIGDDEGLEEMKRILLEAHRKKN